MIKNKLTAPFTDYQHPSPNDNDVAHATVYNVGVELFHGETVQMLRDKTRDSYRVFKDVIWEQYVTLTRIIRFRATNGEPYANSQEMLNDVWDNQTLIVRRSFGRGYQDIPEDHPMAELRLGLPFNDYFRAVHDVLGHAATFSGFGPKGEKTAWLNHRATMPPEALNALWCETRGQNAWTNFYGNHASLPLKDRPFAPQIQMVVPGDFI